ncbi:MAG TPA: UPF0182 family protein [Blastocatellia bacterium]|nr:UPF0182 family protein [Blastocatellia bacterium]
MTIHAPNDSNHQINKSTNLLDSECSNHYDGGMEDDPIFERKVIGPTQRKRRLWLIVIGVLVVGALFFGSQFLAIYIDALWFSSIGYADVYWYKFRLGGLLFIVFLAATFLILRLSLALLAWALPQLKERPRIRLASIEDIRDVNVLPYVFRPGVWLLSAVVALMYAVSMSQSWPDFALYLHGAPAGASDPIFNHDVSFYLFTLPVLELISSYFTTLSVILFLASGGAAGYLWYTDRIRGFGSADTRRRAIAVISLAAVPFTLALAFSTYLDRFDLLRTPHELFSGATYTDANVRLPGLTAVIVVLLLGAIALASNAFLTRGRLIAWAAGLIVATWIIATVIIPQSVYSFSVKPNELAKESPYIAHNIEMTRRAFALDRFEERPFQPTPTLTADQIQTDRKTVDNIRLWDPVVLQDALKQIQVIRTYYDFGPPDIDRYVINGDLRQVMLSAREMNVNQLPEQSRNWINQHIVYTHGYGVTMATVNEITSEGQPHLVLKNMPVESDAPEIKVTRPEIYFGEETSQHIYVHTKPQAGSAPEFNYPAPDKTDSYNEYEGAGGIPIKGLARKIALSLYLGDGTNMLFSDYINTASRVLFRRNVLERVRTIAPFLLFDKDPYIVIDGQGKLFWIIDAFTYSDRFPYSTAYQMGSQSVNYIRNSVKVVVDAYQGDVKFYVFEPQDPIINSYESIFPQLFHPSSEMPTDLLQHIRYPRLLVDAQAQAFTIYHMQNPQTFYNHEDLWAVATADQGTTASQGGDQTTGFQRGAAQAAPMQPYYVLMQLPGEQQQQLEFASIVPFTPSGRANMIGWMAAESSPEHYGHTLVFSFPKSLTVNGPAQIRARVSQDPTLSAQMTLWNQQGSRLLRGNLLVIPIADSLLYVEPFFLQAENSPLPELRQVAVATQDRLATGKTFAEALDKLFPELGQRTQRAAAQTAQQPAQTAQQPAGQGQPAPNQQPAAPAGTDTSRLAQQAQQLLAEYGQLTAQGKHREAGEKLDQLNQTLEQLKRRAGGQ